MSETDWITGLQYCPAPAGFWPADAPHALSITMSNNRQIIRRTNALQVAHPSWKQSGLPTSLQWKCSLSGRFWRPT